MHSNTLTWSGCSQTESSTHIPPGPSSMLSSSKHREIFQECCTCDNLSWGRQQNTSQGTRRALSRDSLPLPYRWYVDSSLWFNILFKARQVEIMHYSFYQHTFKLHNQNIFQAPFYRWKNWKTETKNLHFTFDILSWIHSLISVIFWETSMWGKSVCNQYQVTEGAHMRWCL